MIALLLALQVLDPEPFAPWRLANQQAHMIAGASLNVATVVLPRGMRNTPEKRLLLVAFIGITYEVGQEAIARGQGLRGDGYGFGLADVACDLLGALLVEGLRALR